MLKSLSTRLLQHLIAQNSWASKILLPFAGKSIQLNIIPVSTALVILENGSLAIAGETNIPDATVTIPPSLLLRLLAKDEAAKLQVQIDGDTHLATAVAKVFSHLQWNYEDDLSRIIGDVPANKMGNLVRGSANTAKKTTANLIEMLSEYWQEESPIVAKKRHVEQFNADVDTLRADVERAEKRLEKLIKNRTHSNNQDSVQ